MKKFCEVSAKTQHKRVDELLDAINAKGFMIRTVVNMDLAGLSEKDRDTLNTMLPRWKRFG